MSCVHGLYETPSAVFLGEAISGGWRNACTRLRDFLGASSRAISRRRRIPPPDVMGVRLAPLARVTSNDLNIWQELEPVPCVQPGADFTTQINALFNISGAGAGYRWTGSSPTSATAPGRTAKGRDPCPIDAFRILSG